MGKTLNLCDCLLATGRELQDLGRLTEAARLLHRLAGFRDLPAPVAEEVQTRLAAIYLRKSEYRAARKHLSCALIYRPSHAHYYYQYATAVHNDPKADPARAVRYYRQAQRLDPDEPRYWSDCGRLLLQLGRTEDGVAALRKAGTLSPDDPAIVARLVEGLCLADRADEARDVLRAARYRNPRDARFRKLWTDFQFRQAADTQTAAPAAAEPVILPFVRRAAVPTLPKLPGRILRLDKGSKAAPHLPQSARLPDTKHAP
jgi:tetratricopeptide (TPR) repeat protein